MKLYKIPKNSPIRVKTEDGEWHDAVFVHIDGAYSLCHLESDKDKIFHLGASTEMIEKDGRYEITNS